MSSVWDLTPKRELISASIFKIQKLKTVHVYTFLLPTYFQVEIVRFAKPKQFGKFLEQSGKFLENFLKFLLEYVSIFVFLQQSQKQWRAGQDRRVFIVHFHKIFNTLELNYLESVAGPSFNVYKHPKF